jgi:hypothetical protein
MKGAKHLQEKVTYLQKFTILQGGFFITNVKIVSYSPAAVMPRILNPTVKAL